MAVIFNCFSSPHLYQMEPIAIPSFHFIRSLKVCIMASSDIVVICLVKSRRNCQLALYNLMTGSMKCCVHT